jgi:hypothetical protein
VELAPTDRHLVVQNFEEGPRVERDVTWTKVVLRVSEIEISNELRRASWHKGSTVSALGFLLLKKSNASANYYFDTFSETMEVIRKFYGASWFTRRIDDETMERVYTFFVPN